jgi:SRSO17 transposase
LVSRQIKKQRLKKINKGLKGKAITVAIGETGDRKKGKKTGGGASPAPLIM